jgi:predicted permease
MNRLRTIWLKLRSVLRSNETKSEIDEELRLHVEQRIAENIAAGMSPDEAARAARRRFGNVQSIRESCRDIRGTNFGETAWQDVRFGLRSLLKNPAFTTVAVLTLALGIGATTAIYSVVNTVLLDPVPGPGPDRLVQIGERTPDNADIPTFGGISTPTLEILRTKQTFFSDVVWMESLYLERNTEEFIEGIHGTAVSPNFFAQWNIPPILGRTFSKEEAVRLTDYKSLERDTVMVVSHSFWQSRFGGQPDVLGKTIEANGHHFTIIGVMPRHFQFPNGAGPAFWLPVENSNPHEELPNLKAFVRLKPGVTFAQTQAMLDALGANLVREYPSIYNTEWRRRGAGFALLARPLSHEFTQTRYGAIGLQRTLFGLLAAIGFVLLIGCANVANLMLARTEKRQQELAIRAAVGASRTRLIRQLLVESLLLATCGALAGLAVTVGGMKVLTLLIPENLPRLRPIHIDGHALAFTLLVSIGTAFVFGLVPAWHASRASVSSALKRAGAGATVSASWRRYRGSLVIAEVALSLLLLTGAGLMIESVFRLLHDDPGFDSENLLLVHPGLLRGEKYYAGRHSPEAYNALFEQLHERFTALPGVQSVGIAMLSGFRLGFTVEGREKPIGLQRAGTGVGASDFFRVMRIPLRAGRYFEKADIGNEAGTVIVNETMARLCWPGKDPLNKTFRDKSGRTYEVVGVIADARAVLRFRSVDPVEPTFYRPYHEQAHAGGYGPYFVIRTQQDPNSLIPAVRDVIKTVERSMTTPGFQVARQTLYNATEAQRTYMLYLVVFASVGLLLAALGIYGVLAYSVGRRTREFGIRMAVGAERRHVLRMVLLEGGRLVGAGVVVGLVAAFWLTRLIAHQLFEVSPTEPRVFVGVVLLLAMIALAACFVPAWRATRINPMEALRYE